MTIDCRNFNLSGPAEYRTNAKSEVKQFCYFNQKKKDKVYNKLLSKRIASDNSNVIFQIDSLVNTTKNGEIKLFKAVFELKDLTEKNGRDNEKQTFAGETECSNLANGNGRRKIERRPKFIL